MDGATIDESGALFAAASTLAQYTADVIAEGGEDPAHAVVLADELMQLCIMWKVRADQDKEAQPEA